MPRYSQKSQHTVFFYTLGISLIPGVATLWAKFVPNATLGVKPPRGVGQAYRQPILVVVKIVRKYSTQTILLIHNDVSRI
jgi:hypothetical protein